MREREERENQKSKGKMEIPNVAKHETCSLEGGKKEKNEKICRFFRKNLLLFFPLLSFPMGQKTGSPTCCLCKRSRQTLYYLPEGYSGPIFPPSGWKMVQKCCRKCLDFSKDYILVCHFSSQSFPASYFSNSSPRFTFIPPLYPPLLRIVTSVAIGRKQQDTPQSVLAPF